MDANEDTKMEILIHFEPEYRIELPPTKTFVGKVKLMLPEVHVKFLDLSLGIDLLQGAHLGSDGRVFSLDMTIPEPGMTAGEMVEFLGGIEPQLRQMHTIVQHELDKKFLLG